MTKDQLQQIKARCDSLYFRAPETMTQPEKDRADLLELVEQQQAEIEQKKVIADTLGDLLKEQGKEIEKWKSELAATIECNKDDLATLANLEKHLEECLPCPGAHHYFENIDGAKIDLKNQREEITRLKARIAELELTLADRLNWSERVLKERDQLKAVVDRAKEGIKWAMMHLGTNFDVDGNSMKDSDSYCALKETLATINSEGESE